MFYIFDILFAIISLALSMLISMYLRKTYKEYGLKNRDFIYIGILDVVFYITMINIILSKHFSLGSIEILAIYFLSAIISSMLASSFVIDVLFKELPDENNIILGISLFLISIIAMDYRVIYSSIILFIIFFILSVATNMFGMGDVKIMTMMGLGFYPDKILSFIFTAFLLATIYSVAKIVFVKNREDNNIAFGPFLIISFLMIL